MIGLREMGLWKHRGIILQKYSFLLDRIFSCDSHKINFLEILQKLHPQQQLEEMRHSLSSNSFYLSHLSAQQIFTVLCVWYVRLDFFKWQDISGILFIFILFLFLYDVIATSLYLISFPCGKTSIILSCLMSVKL